MIEQPKTYTAYGTKTIVEGEGEEQTQYQQEYVIRTDTAESAEKYINFQTIAAAIENVKSTNKEEMSKISEKLNDLAAEGETAIVINGANISRDLESYAHEISTFDATSIYDLDGIITKARESYNKKQRELNSAKYDELASLAGCIRVEES